MTKKCESEAKEGPRRNSQNFENNDKKRSKVYSPMFLFFAIKIYTADFTYRTLYTSNVAARMCYSVADQDLEIRGREGFGGGGGGVRSLKNFLRPFGLKKSGGPGPPATKKHGICEFYSFR